MIGIIDYGSGNFGSVYNAVSTISSSIKTITKPEDFSEVSHIILPGVGSFLGAMKKIQDLNLINELEKNVLELKKPYLGICVGMQILANEGLEFGSHKGLGWVEAKVEELNNERLPHVGWNEIEIAKKISILEGIEDKATFYFVNSFAIKKVNDESVAAYTDYEEPFISVIQKENIFGVQFHPEKSQDYGLQLLQNFINL